MKKLVISAEAGVQF